MNFTDCESYLERLITIKKNYKKELKRQRRHRKMFYTVKPLRF